jgi:two-component system, response regulator YesN
MLGIVVVDDEELIRKGLIKIITKSGMDISILGEASNGQEALEVIRRNIPDLVITDVKMPKMDGIELIQQIELEFPGVRKIVLSGFDDFNYVRDTMRRGAMDYLLKPVDDVQLIDLLKKIESELEKEKEKKEKEINLKMQLDQSLPLLKEQFVQKIICETVTSLKDIERGLENYNIDLLKGEYQVLLISMDNHKAVYERLGAEEARHKVFALRNISEESILRYASFVSCHYCSGIIVAISISDKSVEDLNKVLMALYSNLTKDFDLQFSISMGRPVNSLTRLKESYDSAVSNLRFRFYNRKQTLLYAGTDDGLMEGQSRKDHLAGFLENCEDRLKSCVELANPDTSTKIVEELCSRFFKVMTDPVDALWALSDVFSKIKRSVPEFEKALAEVLGFDYSYEKALGMFDTLEEVKKYTTSIYTGVIERIMEMRKRKDRKLVEAVKEFVQKHYCEEITLKRLAEAVYANASYICDLFKSQTGENFVEYLTRLRIEKAKSLLKDVRIKTYEVGQLVGYPDATYFSKVFKKMVGVTPSEYRNIVE